MDKTKGEGQMQILGKKSKILLIVVVIAMLVAIGISFATWDNISEVKAVTGNSSTYASAKVGETVFFGEYYQTGEKDSEDPTEYKKTPIEWIVVDKDERYGQLTLMSKYILASGSYFGNYYYSATTNEWGAHYDGNHAVAGIAYNQAYVDSTARAFLNNLERLDLGGDSFDASNGYLPSAINSTKDTTTDGKFMQGTGLLSSAGFSNQRYWTKLNSNSTGVAELLANPNSGLFKRKDAESEVYYQRPIKNIEYKNRPATRGFFDEAFSYEEKSMIVPKQIPGYTGHRWPDNAHDIATKSYAEGAVDKVWLPSATELNIMNGQDWNSEANDAWTNPSDESGSTVFEYFKNYQDYGFSSITEAVKTTRTNFAKNSFAMNYSIPIYKKGVTDVNTDIHSTNNSTDNYWTRSPMSSWYTSARTVYNSGLFFAHYTTHSYIGVRPCVILKY